MATVDVAGTHREACLANLPDAVVGDWVLFETGFALTLLDEESALESLALFDELGVAGQSGA